MSSGRKVLDWKWCSQEQCVKIRGQSAAEVRAAMKTDYNIDILSQASQQREDVSQVMSTGNQQQPEQPSHEYSKEVDGASDERQFSDARHYQPYQSAEDDHSVVQQQDEQQGGVEETTIPTQEQTVREEVLQQCVNAIDIMRRLRLQLLDDADEQQFDINKESARHINQHATAFAELLRQMPNCDAMIDCIGEQFKTVVADIEAVADERSQRYGLPRIISHFVPDIDGDVGVGIPQYVNEYRCFFDLVALLFDFGELFAGAFSDICKQLVMRITRIRPRF